MKNILSIQNKLKKIDKEFYIVGGFCREKILWNENSWDIDIVTNSTPDEVKKVLEVTWEVGKKYGTCIVLEWDESFEITTFRKDIGSVNHRKPAEVEFTDSLEQDALRRDFTCNAIYYNPELREFIDPTWGINDIKAWVIRFVWNIEDRIKEDALRILRFIRFKNKYNFKVADEGYWKIIKKHIKILKNIPIERIRQELDKILLDWNNVEALEDLKKIWFIETIIPELDCLDKFPGNKHHLEWDVWTHTKMCVLEMNGIVKREKINWQRKLMLIWAILLHDIWKAPTFSIWEDWETHYYKHETIWAEMFKNDLVERLRFSNNFGRTIYFIIKEHLRVFKIANMRKLKARKLMMDRDFEDLLLVWEADTKWRIPQKTEWFEEIVYIYKEFKEILPTKKFFTWNDILEKYPNLKWKAIWERLKQLNDQILIRD